MKPLEDIATDLSARREAMGLSVEQLAKRAGCSVLDAQRALSGDPAASAGVLHSVADALGYVLLAVPKPAAAVVAAGFEVTEPKVLTKVAAALASLRRGPKVVVFLDLDGCVHATGDSRLDDRGQLVGENMFRWWPNLREVLDEFPQVRVVVHSSWRKFFPRLEYLRELMPADLAERVVDMTDPSIHLRYESISEYLGRHPEVSAYVVVDDEDEGFPTEVPLVKCNPKKGLGDARTLQELRVKLRSASARG
jgi:transcriptional regulator with XRE-family HTH domain